MDGNIFINYRREESAHIAGRLHDALASTFGRNKLFMDVDNIPVGRDFEEYLKSQVAACDAMLTIIGPTWVEGKNDTGQRRLDNPDDFVLIEIGAALARDIPVVPVASRRGSHAKGERATGQTETACSSSGRSNPPHQFQQRC